LSNKARIRVEILEILGLLKQHLKIIDAGKAIIFSRYCATFKEVFSHHFALE